MKNRFHNHNTGATNLRAATFKKLSFKSAHMIRALLLTFLMALLAVNWSNAQSFGTSNLNFNGNGGVDQGTSLMFGPDGRLYVLSIDGSVDIFTVQRNDVDDYIVTASEELTVVKSILNHDDDGSVCTLDPDLDPGEEEPCFKREATGIAVAGTATNPIIYVTSSDARIGGPSGDANLDTNSGIITRISWNGSSWITVDMVRGLPRSEENHATNGLEFVNVNGTDFLIVSQGGHANAGAPSDNFAWTTEYALSAAVLSVNLTMLEGMSIQTDPNSGRSYIYDIPTLDDPTRANVGPEDPDAVGYTGIDVNDPFGGNDGLNQAMIVIGGPVQIFSAGYRNSYDLTVTQSGAVYITDNGANPGWGGLPDGEGTANVTNNYIAGEPGSSSPVNGEQVDNLDHLTMATNNIQTYSFGSFYGGHPVPVRANPVGAGLYTNPSANSTAGAIFRTLIYDPDESRGAGYTNDASIALPANWPPVPVSLADIRQGDWRGPGTPNPDGPDDILVTTWGNNTNGIDEYTASNFGGAMQGDLIAGKNGGVLRRVQLNPDGSLNNLINSFQTNLGGNALGITCNSDDDAFPGTIWVATFNGTIKIFEPQDFVLECLLPGEPGYLATADGDNDGYTNQDEIDNKLSSETVEDVICSNGNQPDDFDKSVGGILVSNLNDDDDDNDGVLDSNDAFQLGDPATSGNDAFDLPVNNTLLSDNPDLKGYLGLGFTGLMNNGSANPNWQNWLDVLDAGPNPNDILGGAVGAMTMQMTSGTADGASNTQEKGFQYGVNVDQTTGAFQVEGSLLSFTDPLQLYGSSAPADGELGLFIGDGTQSNFIKFVVTQNGIEAVQEINDVPQTPGLSTSIATGNRPQNSVVMRFSINAVNGEVTLQYSLDGGTFQTLGMIAAQGAILNAIQNSNTPLAVGLSGSSKTNGVELEGTWDYLNVSGDQPTVTQPLASINKFVDDPSETIDLNNYFDDDNGVANLTYSVENNTNAAIGAAIVNNILTLNYPSEPASSSITIRATDGDGLFTEQMFEVSVTNELVALYRVNSNGSSYTDADANQWIADNYFTGGSVFAKVGQAIENTTDDVLYEAERFGNFSYDFPLANGDYTVELHFAEIYFGLPGGGSAGGVGSRVFDVNIEGGPQELTNYDIVADVGPGAAVIKSFPVTVTDGTLNIVFTTVTNNAKVSAIAILGESGAQTPLIWDTTIADQVNSAGEVLDGSLVAVALGGDGNTAYSAVGLPLGVEIEPTNGNVFGTIDSNAYTNSPYTVTITADDSDTDSNDAISFDFVWTVTDPNSTDPVLYRINTGGALTASNDSSSTPWEEDQKSAAAGNPGGNAANGTPSPYVNSATQDLTFGAVLPPSFVNTTGYPEAIFATERYNSNPEPNNMQWSFPTGNGDFQVNLLFNENWAGENDNAGNHRIFDVEIESQNVLNDYRPSFDGTQTNIAKVESFQVNVSDGVLNIDFIQINQNPAIKGIEIVSAQPPVSDEWTAQTDDENYTARHECSFVQAGDKFYLFGGRENPADLDVYDYQSKTWSTIGASAPDDFNHFQAVEHNGLIWVIGAFKNNIFPNEAPADFVWAYNPATDKWIQGPAIPTARKRGSSGLVVYNNKFYIIAGNTIGHNGGFVPWFDEFDPATGVWTTLDNAPIARDHFHAGVIGDKLYVAGGRQSGPAPDDVFEPLVPQVDVYDFTAGTWSTLPAGQNIPTPRAAASVAVFQNELYVIGGEVGDDLQGNPIDDALKTTESFNPSNGTWTTRADLITERHGTQAIVSGDGIHLTAGSNTKGGAGTMKDMEFLGNDNPSGEALTAGQLTIPNSVSVPAGGTQMITLNHNSGNTAIIITSIQIGGADSSEFNILSNSGFSLLNPGETLDVLIDHTGSEEGSNASLVVAYDNGSIASAPIISGASGNVLFRVNSGGALITDAEGDFEADQSAASAGGSATTGTPSPYINVTPPAADNTFGSTAALVENNTGYPDEVFQTERWSDAANPNNMQWSFLTGDGTFQVNLLFNENWADENNNATNNRIFDVEIENDLVLDDYRPSGDGTDVNVAKVESFQVVVSDGTLNINFLKGNQNPSIKGIEILSVAPTTSDGPIVTNPGAQVGVEGDVVNLPIIAVDGSDPTCGPLTYSAENLPANVTIDENTGVISGTLLAGTGSGTAGAFIEENGIVVIEMESTDNLPGSWVNAENATSPNIVDAGNATGGDFIVWEGSQFLASPGNGLISYPIEITTTGTYKFQWRTQVGNGTNFTDHNDTWLKIEGDAFYGEKGASIVCPKGFNGSSNDCSGNAPNGAGGNGWFKVFSSSSSTSWTWTTFTSDNDSHQIFARFDTPGTYNILISARSSSHLVDRMVLSHVSAFSGNPQSTSLPESERAVGAVLGASEDSPYDVVVTVTDACDPQVSSEIEFTWNVTATEVGNPAATIAVNSGDGITASTFGNNSFVISNTGDDDIVNITINTTTGFMKDIVFDPVGTAGDSVAKCLTSGSGSSPSAVGLNATADNSGQDDCVDVFTQFHNGVNNEEGYDILSLDFTDFNQGETFNFGIDIDPTTIKGDVTSGDAGSVSGFELIGATVSIEFASGLVYKTSLFDEGTLGGSDAILNADSNALVAPSILVDGLSTSRLVTDANQLIEVSGQPNASITLLRVDARLYLDQGNPSEGFDIDLFEANQAMAKQLYSVILDATGKANIPVSLTQTTGAPATPDGGLNHFIAVTNGVGGVNSIASNVIVLEYDPNAIIGPAVLVEISPDADLDTSTFGSESFQITNNSTGGLQITNVSIDLSTGLLPDMVFDPIGAGGDATAKCFDANSGAVEVGLVVPADPCTTPFSQPRFGGYDVMSIDFTEFDPGETFTFATDVDPNSIKDVPGAGAAGSVSGFELIGATVTITFNDNSTITSSIYEDGSLGGGQTIVALQAPSAPSISVVGSGTGPATVNDLNQTVTVTGTPGDVVSVMLMDSRLYIASNDDPFNVLDPTYYANEAMAKSLYTGLIGQGGTVDIPVVLLETVFGNGTPQGGLNQIVAVSSNGAYTTDKQVSSTSNVVTLLYDPNAVTNSDISISASLQSRTNQSGIYTVKLYEVGAAVPAYDLTSTADANGAMIVNDIAPGTYELALKYPNSLQVVQTITVVAGTNTIDMGELPMGDANNDNVVSLADFGILSSSFTLSEGQPGYNASADFSGDGVISLGDFGVLSSNFTVFGQEPSGL